MHVPSAGVRRWRVAAALVLLALLLGMAVVWRSLAPPAPDGLSVAVLPFDDFDGDPRQVRFAEAFTEEGWRMRPRAHLDGTRLPLYLHRLGGETIAQPCAEVAFGVDDAQALLAAGLLPLVAPRESDAVRLAGLGSVAERGGGVRGRWEGVE